MGVLRFRVAERIQIVFGESFVEFTRGVTSIKPLSVTFSNGTGQLVSTNQILYTYLTPADVGYIQIKSLSNQLLNGSGILNLSITHYAGDLQADQSIIFSLYGGSINILMNYNSNPVAEDIIKDIPNRSQYVFQVTDFTDNYNDYDNDPLDQVSIYGNVAGYQVNSNPYFEGDWISLSDIDSGLFVYNTLDQDAYYEKDNTWKAKDTNGNISE